jgi:hypothetical protein
MFVYTLVAGKRLDFFSPIEKVAIVITLLSCDVGGSEEFQADTSANTRAVLRLITKEGSNIESLYHNIVVMNLLADPQSNILAFLPEQQLIEMWALLMDLQEAVDVRAHFRILGEVDRGQARNAKWYKEPSARALVMKLLLMAIRISDIARPFERASMFKESVLNRLYDGIDLSMCYGLIYRDESKTREKLDREASTVAMLTYVCIPLLNRTAEIFPVLGLSAEQTRQNMKKWERGSFSS